jgi:hypothetical protein
MRSKLLQTNSLFRLSRTLLQPDSYPFSQIPTDRDDGPCDLFRLTDRGALDGSKMQALSTSLYPRMHLYTGCFIRGLQRSASCAVLMLGECRYCGLTLTAALDALYGRDVRNLGAILRCGCTRTW